jgi:hypothetical protein
MESTKIQSVAALCLSFSGLLMTGCQCPIPVRECRVENRDVCAQMGASFKPPLNCYSSLMDQNDPDGLWHLAGGPLYYQPDNLNWEQAPPFGTW